MEYNIFIIVFIITLYLIALYFYNYYLPKVKGAIGEYLVARRLQRLNRKYYKTFNDIYVEANGRIVQIDHLVISIYGIFVIETKNHKGWIHGHEKSEYWTQSIYKHKNRIINPIRQNWGHISVLKKIFPNLRHDVYHPIVVFSGRTKLKNVYSKLPVIYKRKLIRTIKQEKTIYFSMYQVEELSLVLNEYIIKDKKDKKAHIKQVKSYVNKRKDKIKSGICPNCGGTLVLRKGKYGKFYGCFNFPRCTFSKSLKL